MIATNDLKKGTRILLRNHWQATLLDNQRGNIRLAEVEGIFTESGSIYAHDIIAYKDANRNWQNNITYTPAQLKCKERTEALGF